MKLLAIDTSTDACSVALAVDAGALCEETDTPRVHARQLLSMIDGLLAQASLRPANLDGIVVGVGPGSFTGVRIGCSVAQGLALAVQLPVLPVSSLATVAARFVPHAYARPDPRPQVERVIVAQDARMGELYWGAFAPDAQSVTRVLVADRADPPAQMLAQVQGLGAASTLLAGTGAQAHAQLRELLREQDHCLEALPSARDALALGARDLAAGGGVPPERALPVYFRAPV